MDYAALLEKRDQYQKSLLSIPEYTLQTYEQAFEVEYTHNSTAIEGNTLTLVETKVILEDGISVGGKKLRELYEVVNHRNAYRYVKECIAKKLPLDEKIVKDIHATLMDHIFIGGIYRDMDVYISGAQHTPPSPNEMYRQVKNFYIDLTWNGKKSRAVCRYGGRAGSQTA
ncbi:MAG: Fic family protein [Lachnospiraceae bacterium]|nr:Fic family protein [Lachnospiraceae bacterium]